MVDPITVVPPRPPPSFPPMVGHISPEQYGSSIAAHHCPPTTKIHMLDAAPSWQPPQPPSPRLVLPPLNYNPLHDGSLPQAMPHPQDFLGCGNQYPRSFFAGPGDGVMKLGSAATKESKKKRMARQRRFFSHHHRSQSPQNNSQNEAAVPVEQHSERVNDGKCAAGEVQASHGTWLNWPAAAGCSLPLAGQMHKVDCPRLVQGHSYQRKQIATD
ncbi:hypothetical protein Nepgr_029774 [Nepenthes gracilis]|uniref:Uncharacterized protein n=1 Tax=Nepenthes gracilis TaxID=150966 RepID=A0AAD3Y5V8_NEPGR|nr:hypothetical protein Nepgr_029774 [Nepenthes gracilis]